jgi:hypothetical protein
VPAKATLNQTVEIQTQVVTIEPPGSDAVTNEAADVILELAENQTATDELVESEFISNKLAEINNQPAEVIDEPERVTYGSQSVKHEVFTNDSGPVEHKIDISHEPEATTITRVPADTSEPVEITDDQVKVTATNKLVVNEVTTSEPAGSKERYQLAD